jgi:TPR repeat protein
MQRSEPVLSKIEAEMLVSRGDEALAMGDVTAARLFYRRGADGGDSTAALRLGATFDPAFLAQARVGRVAGDPALALYWYRRAHDLGNRDADLALKSFEPAR